MTIKYDGETILHPDIRMRCIHKSCKFTGSYRGVLPEFKIVWRMYRKF